MDDSFLPMTEVQTRALTKSRSFLVKHLTLANITDDLVAKGVFTDAMLEEVEVKRTPTEKKQKLLTDLVRRPKDCFEKFIGILADNGERHCAAEIRRNEESAETEVQDSQQMLQRLRSGFGRRSHLPHYPPMQLPPHPPAQHFASPASTSPPQPAEQEMRSPVQETDDARGSSAGMSSLITSTGTSQARTSSSLPSGETTSLDDLDHTDAGRHRSNPGPQLQGASPMPETVSKYERMIRTNPDDVYKHETTPRGLALIINNVIFDRLDHRTGSEYDRDVLHEMLTDFGMEVKVVNNLKGQEMKQEIQEFARNRKLLEVHSCVVAIMSHGSDHGKICGTDYAPQGERTYISMDDIKDMFSRKNCPLMKSKPKFFIIQACRGGKEDISRDPGRTRGVQPTLPEAEASDMDVDDECLASTSEPDLPGLVIEYSTCPAKEDRGRITGGRSEQLMREADKMDTDDDDGSPDDEEHEMADFFIAYATCAKYVAYRYLDMGSPFIQALVGVFQEHARNMHVADMLTKVNHQFSKRTGGKRTVAQRETTLRHRFYLNPPRQ